MGGGTAGKAAVCGPEVAAIAEEDDVVQQHTIDYPGATGDMAEQPHDEMRSWQGRDLMHGRRAL